MKLKQIVISITITEYDFYHHGVNQTVKLYFTENNQGAE